MLGVDDRLITPDTMKWVKVGLIAGLATVPTTILLCYVLGLTVDAAVAGSNLMRQDGWYARMFRLQQDEVDETLVVAV